MIVRYFMVVGFILMSVLFGLRGQWSAFCVALIGMIQAVEMMFLKLTERLNQDPWL